MKELQTVVRAWTEARARGEPVLLATVVETAGSTYRRPGARLLMAEERWLAGGISGGCLEGDVLKRSWWRTSAGAPVLVTYDSTSEDDEVTWGFGLGCNGRVEVLLERLSAPGPVHPLALAERVIEERRPAVLGTVYRAPAGLPVRAGQRLAVWPDGSVHTDLPDPALASRIGADAQGVHGPTRRSYSVEGGTADVLLERLQPPQALVVFGSGFDAVPLVRLAAELGWRVTVVADRPTSVSRAAFAGAAEVVTATPGAAGSRLLLDGGTAVVVMTHNLDHDAGFLRVALASPCAYVGVLGPRRRTELLVARARASGLDVSPERLARVHAPVGLDVAAEQPEEIALAIVGEIQAVLGGRAAGFLRDRPGPLHPEP